MFFSFLGDFVWLLTSQILCQRYDEAAQHMLDALVLQDNDGVREDTTSKEKRGVVSSTMWDSLRTTFLHIPRPDLMALCDSRDLEGMFRFIYYLVSSFYLPSYRSSQQFPIRLQEPLLYFLILFTNINR